LRGETKLMSGDEFVARFQLEPGKSSWTNPKELAKSVR
jgi:hypothetical protein